MKKKLTLLAVSGLMALGAYTLPAGAASIPAAGSLAATVTAPDIRSGATQATEVRHRGWRHRHHRRHHRWGRGGASIEFHFGTAPRYRYAPRYRHAPRYRPRGLPAAHVDWCFDRYRSYRLRDNSYQPYHGPRRQCRSPYY